MSTRESVPGHASAATPHIDPASDGDDTAAWVEPVARAGYAAKGMVYAIIGVLAIARAAGLGGETADAEQALQQLAGAPLGMVLLGLVAIGLIGYVIWRCVQALLDPEDDDEDESALKDYGMRAFYLVSAMLYGVLAYHAIELLLGSGGSDGAGGEGAAASGQGGSGSTQGRVAEVMEQSWGRVLVGGAGVAIAARGLWQFGKVYTESFRKRIRSFDLGPTRRRWALLASRVGLTARGLVFLIIGGSILRAALQHDPSEAQGLEELLASLTDTPWLLGLLGLGLVGYAIYQWVKARYRLIG